MPLSLRRNALWMVLGQCVRALCQWGILMVLARLSGPDYVGQFALAVAIATPVIIFSQLQLRMLQAVDVTQRYQFSDYFAVRTVATTGAMVVIIGIAFGTRLEAGVLMVVLIVSISKCLESLSDIFHGLEQRYRRFDLLAQSNMIRSILSFGCVAAVTTLTGEPLAGLLAMAAVSGCVLIFFDRHVTADWRRLEIGQQHTTENSAKFKRQLGLAYAGLPLAIAVTMGSLNTYMSRYFVEGIVSTAALGMFAATAYFVQLGNTFTQALCQAAAPEMAIAYRHNNFRKFRKLLYGYAIMGVGLGVGGILASVVLGVQILSTVYGPEFAVDPDLFTWIMLVGLASYPFAIITYALTTIQMHRIQPIIQGISLVVNIVCCVLLIPTMGLAGAALAWSIACLCRGLLGVAVLWYRLDQHVSVFRSAATNVMP